MIRIKQNKICLGDYDFLSFFDSNIDSVSQKGAIFLECQDNHLKVYFNYSCLTETFWKLVDIQLGFNVSTTCSWEKCPNPNDYKETEQAIIPYIFEILLKGYVSTNDSIKIQYEELRFSFVGSLKDEYFRTDRFELMTTFEEFVTEFSDSLKGQYKTIENEISIMSDEEIVQQLMCKKIIYAKEFEHVNKVRILKIPNTIKTVEAGSLSEMQNVKAVAFEKNESLHKLDGVLNNCESVQVLVFHEGLEQLLKSGNGCTELQEVKLPQSLRVLKNCFSDSEQLKEIFIPRNVRYVSDFYSCEKLEKIIVDSNNQKYASYDDCLYSKDLKILYSCPPGKRSISIPQETEIIAEYALNNCSKITEITLPKGLKEIQQYAFVRSNFTLKKIVIPANTVIHPTAFTR